jgi:ferritin
MKTTLKAALQEQFLAEYESSYLYLAMAAYFDQAGFSGLANWMKQQAKEELGHAMKYYDYLIARKESVTFSTIAAPKANWKSVKAVFEDAYKHEQKITESIGKLADLALDQKDHATYAFLQWFVTEQTEEENQVEQILHKLTLAGENPVGIMMLDRELGSRA